MDDNEKRNKEKLDFFLAENLKVHVERRDRKFWNGMIISEKSDGIYIFDDDKFGERLLFVSDVWEVNEYLEEGK